MTSGLKTTRLWGVPRTRRGRVPTPPASLLQGDSNSMSRLDRRAMRGPFVSTPSRTADCPVGR